MGESRTLRSLRGGRPTKASESSSRCKRHQESTPQDPLHLFPLPGRTPSGKVGTTSAVRSLHERGLPTTTIPFPESFPGQPEGDGEDLALDVDKFQKKILNLQKYPGVYHTHFEAHPVSCLTSYTFCPRTQRPVGCGRAGTADHTCAQAK